MGQCAEYDCSGDAASRTLHCLIGADPGSELVPAYGLTDEVRTGVGGEYRGEGIEDPVSAFGEVSEKDEVAERPRYQEGAQATPHHGADELQLLALLQVEDAKAEDYGGGGKHRQDHLGEKRSAHQEKSSQPQRPRRVAGDRQPMD